MILDNFDYKPHTLIADGADAITNGFMTAFGYQSANEFTRIMCWAHVYRKVEEYTKKLPEELRNKIREDIESLQALSSPELFDAAYLKFVVKWAAKKNAKVDEFLEYFRKEWIESANHKWYEGAAIGIPSHDNGLEALNGSVKTNYTMRERLPVQEFLCNTMEMLRDWSKNSMKEKEFHDDFKVDSDTWTRAHQCLAEKRPIHQINQTESYLVVRPANKSIVNKFFLAKKYERVDLDFDGLINHVIHVPIVNLKRESWTESQCSCKFYMKNYFCKHIIVVAVSQGLGQIPIEYNDATIAGKAKRGRPSKAEKALRLQKDND
jgi:hypothetical protein